MMTKTKKRSGRAVSKKSPSVGARIIEGLEEALAWSKGEDVPVRVTQVEAPNVDISKVRRRMGLSQTQFAMKFGFPPATLRNWEQGRVRPDAPTRVLLAVIAKHPESVEDVLEHVLKDVR
jgi:putative transcriptional regulator